MARRVGLGLAWNRWRKLRGNFTSSDKISAGMWHSIRNMLNSIVITFIVTYGNQIYHGYHFIMYANVRSLCSTPETNIIFYINYISLKKKKNKRRTQIHWGGLKGTAEKLPAAEERCESYFAREYPRDYPDALAGLPGCLASTHWTLEETFRRHTPAVGNCLELM